MERVEIPLTMESPKQERAILDINGTTARHWDSIKNRLPVHAVSGCDTVASYFDGGKSTVIKVLKKDTTYLL